jgi:hypothetical protein
MEQEERRQTVTIEVEPDVKRWLERKAAERIIEGRPHGERSVGAVIRDLLHDAVRSEKATVTA